MYTVANNSPEEVRPKTEPILRGYRRQQQRVCSEFCILVSCCIPPCTTAAKEKSCKAKNKKQYLYYTGGENIFTKSRLRKPYICQEVPARAKKGRRAFSYRDSRYRARSKKFLKAKTNGAGKDFQYCVQEELSILDS